MMRLIQSGPRTARIIAVGEAPGKREDETGLPFVGASGEVLDRMLSRAGIQRSDVFVTNIAHIRPPNNDFKWFLKPKIRPELALGLLQLKKDIEEIKPNVILGLGAQPLFFLTGKLGIDKWRGSVLASTLCPPTKVIATYHPAYILRVWDYKGVAEFDLARCAKESATPSICYPKRQLILNPSREESVRLVRELLDADWLATDIECTETPSGWRLSCVGFSDRGDRAVTWPVDEPWQRNIVKLLCESPVKKVFQNGQFDVTVLRDDGINVANFAWDTICGHHALMPECAGGEDELSKGKRKSAAIRKGLAFQTSIYTDEPYYKDDGKLWKETGDLNLWWEYNAKDAAVTREIRDVQERELRAFGTLGVLEREMAVLPALMAMSQRGIKIDLNQRDRLKEEYEKEIERLQNFLDIGAGQSVNVKSSKQVQWLLYDKLRLPEKRSRKTGNPTADKDAIIELGEKYQNPLLHTILGIRKRRDFIERYLKAIVDPDQRMRCTFDPTGTRSGRLSSRASIRGSGTNLQNIPIRSEEGQGIRQMFLADEGKVFVYRDFSQAEARIVAYQSTAQGLIELFEDPARDVHTENASRIFSRSLDSITETERYQAKRVVHASNYGMGPARLVQVVNEEAAVTGISITFPQAKTLIDRYFMLYPEIREVFWSEVEREMRYSRTLNTPFGRKRQFFGRWDEKLMREAYSYIPQSTVGDLGVIALTRCYEEVERVVDGAECMLQVHDSVMMQCYPQDVERVAGMMAEAMNIPITIKDKTFVIPSDCKVGLNWRPRPKKNPELNPDGLVDLEVWLRERGDATKIT